MGRLQNLSQGVRPRSGIITFRSALLCIIHPFIILSRLSLSCHGDGEPKALKGFIYVFIYTFTFNGAMQGFQCFQICGDKKKKPAMYAMLA